MLSVAYLLEDAPGRGACPTCPTCESGSGADLNQGMARASPGCPTCPTKKQDPNDSDPIAAGEQPGRAHEELLHPRDCPQWWKGCLAGCPWYHRETGGDFCWKVNRAWWEEPYQGGGE